MRSRFLRLRGVAAASLALIALGACGGPGAVAARGPVEVVVAEQGDGMSGLSTHIAAEQGFFADEGITVKEFVTVQKGQDAINGMLSGAVQFAHIAPEGIVANRNGAGVVGVASLWASPTVFGVGRPGITSWADLKGKTVAIGGPNDVIAVYVKDLVRKAGLDPETDVKYVPLGATPARMTALLNGQVDATVATVLGFSDAVRAGKAVRIEPPAGQEPTRILGGALQTSRKWAETNRETVVGYLRAIDRANAWLEDPANKQAAIASLMTRNQFPETANADAMDSIYLNPPAGSEYTPDGMRVPAGVFADTVAAFKAAGSLPADAQVTEEEFMDYSYADEALKERANS